MPFSCRRIIITAAGSIMTALMLLLPLKFGGLAVMPEVGGFYPEALFDWLFISYPPHLTGVIGSVIMVLLLLTVKTIPRKLQIFCISWGILPLLAALPGMIYGMPDDTLGELTNLAGIGVCIASGTLLIAEDKCWGKRFAAAFCCGGLWCAVTGIHQYFSGLDELREFAAEQARSGIILSDAMKLKLTDPRIFSTMASSNALASLLLMLTPLTLFFAFKWGSFFEPVKISRLLFVLVFTGITVTAMVMTSSRSTLFCPVAAIIPALLSNDKFSLRIRMILLGLAAVIISGGIFFAIHFGRGTTSMLERADYLRSSALLTVKYPLTGSGWGGFFRTHMTVKLSGTDESARDPHNVVAAFASQAGVIPGIIMLAVLLLPLIWLWKERFSPGFPMAVFWSGVLFSLHSLLDCDWHVPALPIAMGILYAAAINETGDDKVSTFNLRQLTAIRISLACLTVAAFAGNYRYLQGDFTLARLQEKLYPGSAMQRTAAAHLSVPLLIKQLRALRPDSQTSWQLEGDWLLRCGAPDAAEKCYRKAAELDPRRPGIWAKLARLQMHSGKQDEAVKLMQKAHELFPKNPRYDVKKFTSGELP